MMNNTVSHGHLVRLLEPLLQPERISEATLTAARRVLLDQWSISRMASLRGAHFTQLLIRPGRTDREGKGERRDEATLWRDGTSAYAADVVLCNRAAGDSLELTAGPECVAAAIAAAELADSNFGALLRAVSIGAQAEAAVKRLLQAEVERQGLHPPSFFSAIGSAAATSWLLDGRLDTMVRAVSAALCLLPCSPYVAFSHGSELKELYGAFGQQLGFQCGLWSSDDSDAARGFGGPSSVLEGAFGLLRALGTKPLPEPPMESDWAIEQVQFKAYPCSRACHGALTALEGLLPVPWQSIESVQVQTYPFAYTLSQRARPDHPTGAQMHIPTALAIRWIHGELTPLVSFRSGVFDEENVRLLSKRIRVSRFESVSGQRRRVASVTLRFKDGSERTHEAEAKWGPHAPASDAELSERFQRFTGRRWDELSVSQETPVRNWITAAIGAQ